MTPEVETTNLCLNRPLKLITNSGGCGDQLHLLWGLRVFVSKMR